MFSKRKVFAFLFCLLLLVSFAPVPTPPALRVAGVPLVGPAIACAQPIQECDPKDDPGCEDDDQVPPSGGNRPGSPSCNLGELVLMCGLCATGNFIVQLFACPRCQTQISNCNL